MVYHASFAPTLSAVLDRLARRPVLIQVADESDHRLLAGAEDYEQLLASGSGRASRIGPLPRRPLHALHGRNDGDAEGTLWRQADIYDAAIGGVARIMGLDPTDLQTMAATVAGSAVTRFLPAPPFMHGAAGWASLGSLLAGGTVVIQSDVVRFDPADVLATIDREGVNSLLIVGDAFGRPLCEELDRHRYDLSSLIAIVTGGATMSPTVKNRLLGHLPSTVIIDAGGASESGTQMSSVSTKDHTAELGVFTADPTTGVIDDESAPRRPGHPGQGWLAKRGAIPLGYLGDACTRPRPPSRWSMANGCRCPATGPCVRADGQHRAARSGVP